MNSLKKFDPYIIFLAFLTAVPATAIDMVLSAIPTIAKEWSITEAKASLSISLFFVSLSIGLLFYGPLSDKYGRKPILIFSTISFTIASYLCSIATSIDQLLVFRVLQGLSASGASTMSMAICRDKYDGKKRKVYLAYVGMIMSIAPMVAPTVGAYILSHTTWNKIFIVITIFSLIPLTCSIFMKETNIHKSTESILKTALRYKQVLSNKSYLKALFVMVTSAGPFFAFIGFSTIAYISFFNLDEKTFGYLFAFNAFASILGGLAITKLIKHFDDRKIISALYLTAAIATLLIILLGSKHFIIFAILMAVFTFTTSALRPMANAIVLDQVQSDIGTATSLMLFYQFIIGAIYMSIATLKWEMPIRSYGVLSFITIVILLCGWKKLSKQIKAN